MIPPKNIDELIIDLNQPNLMIRLNAQKQLVRQGDPTVIEALIKTLHSGSEIQRAHAAIVLGHLHDIRALGPLLNLRSYADPMVRIDTAKALGTFKNIQAVAALIDWLPVETNVLVQTAIVQALAETAAPQIFTPLVKALTRTPSPSLKYLIIRVLGDLGDPHATEIIFPYVDSPDQHIRRESLIALEKLKENTENL